MKPLALLFLLLGTTAHTATAQKIKPPAPAAAASPPGVVLLKLKWSRAFEFPRGGNQSPFDVSVGSMQSFPLSNRERERDAAAATSSPFPRAGRLRYVYHYTAKIRNDGAKQIKAVVWDYVFSDPDSKRGLGRHRFYNREKISEGEEATLRGRSPSAPSLVVTAKGLERDARSPFAERFEIRCVLYTDGTKWAHPSARPSECDGPRRRDKDRKDKRAS